MKHRVQPAFLDGRGVYKILSPTSVVVAITYRQSDAEEITEWLNRAPSFRGLEDEIERMRA